ncbi:MAG: cysteine--tRNA ligase [Pseudomonadota bacterium]|nr:cysteine--tRNA ligase [Pseudomonadota bacterium]
MEARQVKLYNTLTRRKELLQPLEDGHVKIYACGVTVYDHCHVGHAMQASVFDILTNFLRKLGYRVTYIRNFTDVDDKIIARAKEMGIPPSELAAQMIASAAADFKALGLTPPDAEPRVSQCIADIIAMIADLCAKDFAYPTPAGNVYFRVRSFSNYGRLSNRNVEQLQHNEVASDKQDILDFALWKVDTTASASWPSPWGHGRPGWHIECSAMAKKHLGVSFDIHGGGQDLIFPHHENEIAQSVCANSSPYATIWMHNGLMTVEGQKMSKSLHNHITIKDFLQSWSPEVLRLIILSHHYRSNIDFSQKVFKQTHKRLYYYYQTLAMLQALAKNATTPATNISDDDVKGMRENFLACMCDDLNTPMALALLHEACKRANDLQRAGKQTYSYLELITFFGESLGLLQAEPSAHIAEQKLTVLNDSGISEAELQSLIAQRNRARQTKNYQLADQIRSQLQDRGIELRDHTDRSDWSVII